MTDTLPVSALAQGPRAHAVPIKQIIYWALAAIVALDSLEGMALLGVPLPWLAMSCAVPLAVVYASKVRLRAPPAAAIYLIFLIWIFSDTGVASFLGNYAEEMPPSATTPYPVFILLRAYSFLGFYLLLLIIYNFSLEDDGRRLAEVVVWIGVIATLYAFYVVVAQRVGLPTLPRARWGTGEGGTMAGGEAGQFGDGTDQFLFRAVGSFREPVFLAAWLVVPFFLSLACGRRAVNWRSGVLLCGILGTGSLTTAIAVPTAIVIASILVDPFRKRSLAIFGGMIAFGGGLLMLASIIASNLGAEINVTFIDQFAGRIERILTGGFGVSNRAYAYTKLFDSEFSLAGVGLGNAHIAYSGNASVPISFLSVYIHTWFAGGAIAVALLASFLICPLVLLVARRRVKRLHTVWYVGAYITWLIIYSVSGEEFNLMFAIATGLLLSHLMRPTIMARPRAALAPPG